MLTVSSNPFPNLPTDAISPVLPPTPSYQNDGHLQDPAQAISDEMNKRATNFWYGLFNGIFSPDSDRPLRAQAEVSRSSIKRQSENITTSLMDYYDQIFPQDTIEIIHTEDMGVDDLAAANEFLASKHTSTGKKVKIVAFIPCTGNAVLSQTEVNTMQALELAQRQDIPVAAGAIAPLAMENNQTAIYEMQVQTNATHFYGRDGLQDVGGMPPVTMQLQKTPGYLLAANEIYKRTPNNPITLVSTAALTEQAKILTQLEQMDAQNGLPPGSFAKKIAAISIMGGCLNPSVGCNAPFNVPDSQKNSEANFYFDAPAAQIVFNICQKYQIPILLAPLDLTQQPGLLWTKNQDDILTGFNNNVSVQMSRIASVIPYLDAPCFPNGTYPMHDLQAATCLLYPEFYQITKTSFSINNTTGAVTINSNATEAQKNVYVLSMPLAQQPSFYQKVLQAYKNFSPKSSFGIPQMAGIAAWAAAVVSAGAVGLYTICRLSKSAANPDEEKALIDKKPIDV